jgi:ABC-type branched-subunit amino acid transport system substrate-binding protein
MVGALRVVIPTLKLKWISRSWPAVVTGLALLLSACAGMENPFSSNNPPPPGAEGVQPGAAANAIGTGQVKVALILPLSAQGNAGQVGQSMRNAAELAIAEFNNPDLQLLVKDDAGSPQGAQQAAQQAVNEGAEIILGPLFAQSVQAVGSVARSANKPVIAFSTDANAASRGVYLLSFLPETDVDRIVDYAISQGKRSFVALVPDNPYGSVVEAEFRQYVAHKGGRVMALERYPADPARMQSAVQNIAQAAGSADALFLPGEGDAVPAVAQALAAGGINLKRLQILGTGLWDDPRIFGSPVLAGGWYAGPDPNSPNNYRAFAARYKARYGQEPARTATLSYDAVALVAALVKTQGPTGLNNDVLTNPSGFAGIDGVFRFRPEGTNQRGLAVLRVTPQGGQVIAPAPKAFSN